MAKCHRNDIESIFLDRPSTATTAGNYFRLWTAFSGATLRRKIFDAVSCGASSRHRHQLMQEVLNDTVPQLSPPTTTIKSVLKESDEPKKPDKVVKKSNNNGKSEKLADLLNLAEAETDAETKKKVEALEEFKRVVKELQVEEEEEKKRKAASRVRLLTKEDLEARVTLAMLGAIPPLVAMLDFENSDSQIVALYALLNLGIGNDA